MDSALAVDLYEDIAWLTDRYNRGLSPDPEGDQERITAYDRKLLQIGLYYLPEVQLAGLKDLNPVQAKERHKKALAAGETVQAILRMGPFEAILRSTVIQQPLAPLPAGC